MVEKGSTENKLFMGICSLPIFRAVKQYTIFISRVIVMFWGDSGFVVKGHSDVSGETMESRTWKGEKPPLFQLDIKHVFHSSS